MHTGVTQNTTLDFSDGLGPFGLPFFFCPFLFFGGAFIGGGAW
jgi:hypothetical protein